MSPFLVNPFGFGGGGSPPSLPVSGAVFWVRADTAIFTDNLGATPATSDGDIVQLWKDQSGNGYDASHPNLGPYYRPGTTNRGFATLGFESNGRLLTLPSGLGTALSSAGAGEMYVVIKRRTNNSTGVNGSWTLGTSTDPALYTWSGDGFIHETFGMGSGHLTINPGKQLNLGFSVYNVWAATNDQGVVLDGSSLYSSTSSFTPSFPTTGLLFGYSQTWVMDADVQEIVMFPGKLSSGDRSSMNTYLTT